MATEMHAYDGSSWREIINAYAYDGASWRKLKEGWVYDGASWRQFFTECASTLDSASASPDGSAGCCGCTAGKCDITISWTYTVATPSHHIRILRSINGGSFAEIVDDHGPGTLGSGSYTDGCQTDGNTVEYKVRLEDDGTDLLTCRNSSNEKETGDASPCGAA